MVVVGVGRAKQVISGSVFQSPCGSRGIVGGPHKEFSKIENKSEGMHVENSEYGCFQGPI